MKYLVTGGHGRLGNELCPLIDCIAPTHAEMDILDPAAIEKYINDPSIGAVIHLAAVSNRAKAEADTMQSYLINVHGTANVARAAQKAGKKIFYISTEIVFQGSAGNYRETDKPNPKDWYAFTKYAGELEVQHSGAEHLIIRTTFRPKAWEFPTAYDNVYTTGDFVDVIAQEIAHSLTLNPSGIIHLGTPIKTLFELAKRRKQDIKPEQFPDPTFLRRDLNIEKWENLKQAAHG
jgi:dTDP-4-dehydrorhamnose reductase